MRIVLASKSPRRKELLEQIGIIPEIIVSEADENIDETQLHSVVNMEINNGYFPSIEQVAGRYLNNQNSVKNAKEVENALRNEVNEKKNLSTCMCNDHGTGNEP